MLKLPARAQWPHISLTMRQKALCKTLQQKWGRWPNSFGAVFMQLLLRRWRFENMRHCAKAKRNFAPAMAP
eukprot:10653385-Karenia_brevis.AAC.1